MQEGTSAALPGVPARRPVITKPVDVPIRVRVPVQLTRYYEPNLVYLRYKLPSIFHEEEDNFCIAPGKCHVYEAFVGMFCMVCEDRGKGVALRAVVTEVYRNSAGIPALVGVLYVDSGGCDVVALNCIYPIDADEAAEPRRAVECSIRNLKATIGSTRLDLELLAKRGTLLYEAVFYAASDTGVYAVDLYAKCREKKVGTRTHDVRDYLIANGFAEPIHRGYALDSAQALDLYDAEGGRTPEGSSLLVPLAEMSLPQDELPAGTKALQIVVTYTCSPGHFYGQNTAMRSQLALVQHLLPLCRERLDNMTKIKKGANYVLRETPQQHGARVRVEGILGSGTCRVFLVDYGNRRTVKRSSLYKSHPRLYRIPPLAMRFQLSDVQPRKGDWTESAVDRFTALVDSETPLTAVPVSTQSSHNAFKDKVHVVKLLSPKHGDLAGCMAREGHARTMKSCLVPVQNPTWPYEPAQDDNGPLFDTPAGPIVAEPSHGAVNHAGYVQDYVGPAHLPPSEAVINPVRPLRPPEVGSQVLGQVSAVVSPSCFYLVFPYGRRSVDRLIEEGMGPNQPETLQALTKDLQECYEHSIYQENPHVAWAQGELVAAKSKLDGRWYRARVASLEGNGTIGVFYTDFGFYESLPVQQLRCLEEKFTLLPQQALQACLVTSNSAGNQLTDEPVWDNDSCEAFVRCVYMRDLIVEVVCVTAGLLYVRLFFHKKGRLYSVGKRVKDARKNNSE